MNNLPERLQALRQACGLSYQDISIKSGVSLSTVRRIMLGQSELTIKYQLCSLTARTLGAILDPEAQTNDDLEGQSEG